MTDRYEGQLPTWQVPTVERPASWMTQWCSFDVPRIWSTGQGVIVALIDTGVDAKHPDVAGSVLPGRDMTQLSPDGATDQSGHGTAMASLIAAHGRTKGITPAARILPIRVGVEDGRSGLVAFGINGAVAQGANAALAADVVLIAGAGNRPEQTNVGFPAAFPGVVAVGTGTSNSATIVAWRLLLFIAIPVVALVIAATIVALVLSSRRRNRWNHP